MFKKFGKNYSDDQIEQMIKTIDSDGNRKISLGIIYIWIQIKSNFLIWS